jgi:hypothetical protein
VVDDAFIAGRCISTASKAGGGGGREHGAWGMERGAWSVEGGSWCIVWSIEVVVSAVSVSSAERWTNV